MSQPKCPFCLSLHDFSKSPRCTTHNLDVPIDYITKYDEVPPLWLMAIGYSKHGKTCLLAAISMVLENIGRVWEGTAPLYLDQFTRDAIQEMRRQAITGVVPVTTPVKYPQPLLFHVYKIPEKGDNCLVLYDTPGELFDNLEYSQQSEYMQFLKQIKSIWFVVSLSDLERKAEKRIDDLLSFYLDGMKKMGVSLKGRNLVIVYTKADLVVSHPLRYQFPQDVCDYVMNDPFQNVTRMQDEISPDSVPPMMEYIEEMQRVSNSLQDYTRRHVPGGTSLINIAKINGMGLYFSITSALGSNATNNTLQVDATRYRVIDPFLWALELNRPENMHPVKLILDASAGSQAIYNAGILGQFSESIRSIAEITTHFMGQKSIMSRPNQAPPTNPPRTARPRLVGPILDQTPANVPVIVLTAGRILDLDDYARTWGERLLLVSYGDEEVQNWPTNLVFRSQDKADVLTSEIWKFISDYYNKG